MGSRPSFEVDSWDAAVTLLRHVVPDAIVTVPKATEPTLPTDLPLRRSDVPWSIHKGARRIYRETRPGIHLQIREYSDRWTAELDDYSTGLIDFRFRFSWVAPRNVYLRGLI